MIDNRIAGIDRNVKVEIAEIRAELQVATANFRADLIRWMFVFLNIQIAAFFAFYIILSKP